ncbi:MAG: DNA-3-methyladenine glycosylase [Kiritimatiellia bacterium]|nr:DNA-3-methyladenine glycosylase [Kiritimatiellia bacterium]
MNRSSRRLTASFFLRPDTVEISRELLGKCLFTRINHGPVTGGLIVETEAYAGPQDRASHAYNNRFSGRTAVMYRRGPVAYVYLCYGLHWLFNIITNIEGIPHAVLIRAIQPVQGVKLMLKRRGKIKVDCRLTSGPGVLAQALGIRGRHSGLSLLGREIWLEEGVDVSPEMICASPRIGVRYAGKDAHLPWRFYIEGNLWVSRATPEK